MCMIVKILLVLMFSVSFQIIYAQNNKVNREEFILKLSINEEEFYEQKVESTKYFVNDKVLQIYPSEKLYIELETYKNEITSMKVVKENLNPEKTIKIELIQNVKDKKNEMMMLKIENPFNKDLEYKAMMFIVGHNNWIKTNVLPVKANFISYETWQDIIITLVLTEWKFND